MQCILNSWSTWNGILCATPVCGLKTDGSLNFPSFFTMPTLLLGPCALLAKQYLISVGFVWPRLKKMKCSRRKVLWETWDRFWQGTSIGALGNAGRAQKSPLRCLLWMVVFLVGLGFTGFSLHSVLRDFWQFPVDTAVTIDASQSKESSLYMIIIFWSVEIWIQTLLRKVLWLFRQERAFLLVLIFPNVEK